jgi:two-component system, cell cycle sensor histidine kinase and response regulator CckA
MSKKILVIDNHPVILKFVSDLLENRGYEVRTAADGLSALDILKFYVPDVMFVDLVMPNINGEKLCRIVRAAPELNNVSIVILSGIAAESNLDFAKFGANACIAKGPLKTMAENIFSVLGEVAPNSYFPVSKEVIGIDTIHQREIIKELLSSRSHFEAVLNNMSEGILELTVDERIVYANPSASLLTNVSEEKLLACHLNEILVEPYYAVIRGLMDRAKSDPTSVMTSPAVLLKGRQIIPLVLRIHDDRGESFILMLRDVTEQKRAEGKLIQSQRMEAITTLAGGTAHQFNNALMAIVGNIELIKMAFPGRHDLDKYLEAMKESAYRMSKHNEQLLAYARGGRYQPQKVSFNDFVRQTLLLVEHTIKPRVNLEQDLQACTARAEIDMGQMQMVIAAIIANASEATEDEGRIRVSCEDFRFSEASVTDQLPLKPGDYIRLTIEDEGKGMDDMTRSRIFEPFFTTKSQGRGLGMAAVYGIVLNHDGWITVDSEPGKGTTVRIYLPALLLEEPKPEKRIPAPSQTPKTALVIEDEPMVLEVTRALLMKLGYTVLAAKTGNEGIQVAKDFNGSIDLVILDIVLPDMEGRAVFPLLMEARPGAKVIVCSGYSLEGPAKDIMDKGAQGFLQKPFSLQDLADKINEIS